MKVLTPGILLVAATALAAPLQGQQHPAPHSGHAPGAMAPGMAEHMRAMDSLGARLDTAVARMNRATGEARTPAMQDVLRELVAAHKEMHSHMSMMAGHHAPGDSAAGRASMPHQHQTPAAGKPDSANRPRR